jgi:hypothetical protein
MSPARGILFALLIVFVLGASAAHAETIPPDSWVYEAFRSFELRGLVALEPTLPYTFDQCEAYTREIIANVDLEHVELGPRHRFLLERLTKQFVGTRDRPEERWSKPVGILREDERYLALDFQVGGMVQRKPDEKKGEADGVAVTDFLVGFGHNITMETSYRLAMAPERGSNVSNAKPSARLKSYRGLTAEFERGLIDASGSWWSVRAGREYMHWGGNLREDLLLSRTAGSLDHVGARFALGPLAISTIQAILDSRYQRHLAGHRITAALPRGIFLGIGETVVYQRNLDFKYIMPLSIFYAQQFNEGTNADNVLWSLDWKVPMYRGFIISGEFLVDDLQYQRDELAGPDRTGFYVTADALFMVAGRELEVSGGYTCVDIYTYGHASGTQYVAGDGYVRMNPMLGTPMGPDADRRFVKATYGLSERVSMTIEGVYTRYGAGSSLFSMYLPDWRAGLDNDPPFPSYPVLNVKSAIASLRYDLNSGSYLSAGAWVRHRDRSADNFDEDELLGWLELLLDL